MSAAPAVESRLVETMRELGFTATDAKVYVALVKQSPATGYELAARANVPRSAIYAVLKRLSAQGLVNAVQEKPARYTALAPERLCDVLDDRYHQHLGSLRDGLQKLAGARAGAVTWTVDGYEATLEQADRLIRRANTMVHASVWAREAKVLEEAFVAATNRGVDVVLFSWNDLPPSLTNTFSYGLAEEELEPHWEHKLLLVTDHEHLLVATAAQSDDARAIITDEPALVEVAVANLVLDITLFGERQGVDTGAVVERLTKHLAPVEELLKVPPK